MQGTAPSIDGRLPAGSCVRRQSKVPSSALPRPVLTTVVRKSRFPQTIGDDQPRPGNIGFPSDVLRGRPAVRQVRALGHSPSAGAAKLGPMRAPSAPAPASWESLGTGRFLGVNGTRASRNDKIASMNNARHILNVLDDVGYRPGSKPRENTPDTSSTVKAPSWSRSSGLNKP